MINTPAYPLVPSVLEGKNLVSGLFHLGVTPGIT